MKATHTQLEQSIRVHCEANKIRVENLLSCAVRFTGYGVGFTTAEPAKVTMADLQVYQPRKGQALQISDMHSLSCAVMGRAPGESL